MLLNSNQLIQYIGCHILHRSPSQENDYTTGTFKDSASSYAQIAHASFARKKTRPQEERVKTKSILLIAGVSAILAMSLMLPGSALADGIIIPDPPVCDPAPCPPVVIPMEQLVIRYHHVTVSIQDQLAVTRVDQVFYNPNDWTIEGTYMFPIPEEAAVSGFTLWIDGQPVEGKVLDATEARQTYEQIVASMRDPALLEYVGRGAVQARIFPIAPQGERRIELEYSQALTSEGGLVRYIYPLNTEKFSAAPIESVTISVDIRSSTPIRAVYSPSHEVGVSRESDYQVATGYEASNVIPDTDFALFYSLGETEAFHLLTYRDPADSSDPDGFFLVLLAPRIKLTDQVIPKDLVLVLDRSGSMDGEKFQQAQQATHYILDNLNLGDRFNIITFSTGIQTYASGLRPASEAVEARAWLDQLSAEGSTDINRALLEAAAMVDADRSTYLIFLTDGLPTEGVVDSQSILANFKDNAADNLRLFSFGVGYDVDTILLDTLSKDHHGRSTYVQPGMDLDEILSSFYSGISTPVLTNLELDFGNITTYDLYPNPLPDLFAGTQVILMGRYRQGGETDVKLMGDINGARQSFTFSDQEFEKESRTNSIQSAIPHLWATRKIGYLLNQIRLQGAEQEIIDQIVRLSIRFGIVTPYTSYLVTEQAPLGEAEQQRLANETFDQMMAMPTAAPSGQMAVQKAADAGAMQEASSAPPTGGDTSSMVQAVGARTFVLTDGKWVDTAYDPDRMQTKEIAFLSPEYFDLVASKPELADAFALGEKVIALSNGIAYEVLARDAPAQNASVTPTPMPASSIDPAFTPTQSSTQDEPTKPVGLCSAGFLPVLLAPILMMFVRKPKHER
jgi:Ca-activated chloride channel family protein